MKKCPYCGKLFPNEAVVCDVDQQPLQPDVPAPTPAISSQFPHPMKKELIHVDPLRTGVVLGILYGAMGLILIPFLIVFILIGAAAGKHSALPAVGFGIFMMILAPVFYGVMGFILGIIASCVYNLIAKFTGGLKFEVRDAVN